MGFDYRAAAKLLESIENAAEQYDTFARNFLKKMAFQCLVDTKRRTPVDDGDLRNRWELSDVYRDGDELYVIIFNPLEYASFVEDGHWQHNRFLPIHYLDNGSTKGRQIAARIRSKYGADTKGVKLKEKWIPGYYMSRISVNFIENRIPSEYEKALWQFLKNLGVM